MGIPAATTTRLISILFTILLGTGFFFTLAPAVAQADHCGARDIECQPAHNQENLGGGNTHQSVAERAASGITLFIYQMCVGIGTLFISFGGLLLDNAIAYLVIGMGSMLDGGFGNAIDAIWIIIRDIFNILFIFGLIYIGFKTIWSAGDTDTQRLLVMLIGAALLVNFSLYFAKVIVDFSNIAAYQIYELIQVPATATPVGEIRGISNAFMQFSNIQTYADINGVLIQAAAEDGGEVGEFRIIAFGFMMMIFMIISGFVFAAGAILLITRFIILVLLLMGSPAMFLGWVFPGLEKYGQMWLGKFINNALIAPAFLFMIYLSLSVLRELHTGEGTFVAAFTDPSGSSGLFQIILYFFVITGFMVASLMVAKHFGAVGADRALSLGKGALQKVRAGTQRAAGSAVFGTMGAAGRSLIGKRALRRAESDGLKERASRSGWRGFAARRELDVARAAAGASFDARRVAGMGKSLGIGEGKKGGYEARRDAAIKDKKKYAASLGEVGDDDPEVKRLNKEVKDTEGEIKDLKKKKALAQTAAAKEAVQEEIAAAEEKLKNGQQAVKKEKNRRQIGSETRINSSDREAYAELKQSHQFATGALDVLHANYRQAADDAEKQRLAEKIKEQHQSISKIEGRMRKYTDGYVAVVEQSGWYTNLFTGSNKDINEAIGETIRKDYEKKTKKTKEDERFDSIGDKLEKAAKKDES